MAAGGVESWAESAQTAASKTAARMEHSRSERFMRTGSPRGDLQRGSQKSPSLRGKIGRHAAFSLIFLCYSRNFPSVTFPLQSAELLLCWIKESCPRGKPMKAAVARKPVIRIAVVESDPLRFVGFRALFDSEPEFELISAALPEISTLQAIDLILLGNRNGQNLFDVMASLKATRPDLKIIVTGSGIDEETILKAIASGAKGYVDEAATPAEFAQAIRIVNQGSVWAPRKVLSMFIERVSSAPGRIFPAGRVTFTDREKEVLEMLVAGRSNKEIGSQLGIEERTVKAHVAKLMRKVGVQNRIALSVHAITHSLVVAK